MSLTISGHAGLPGDAGGDDDDICASQSLLEATVGGQISRYIAGGVDVVQIDGYAGCVDDVVKCKLFDEWALYQRSESTPV